MKMLSSVTDVSKRILAGQRLFLAADERCLAQLPQGEWIGGTIPYFIADQGGEFTQEKLYVTEIPDLFPACEIRYYEPQQLDQIYTDIPPNGVGLIIIPANSSAHLAFALDAPGFEGFAARPLIGWISGVHLTQLGTLSPKIFDGREGKEYEDGALVMHLTLPATTLAEINIMNIFEQGTGEAITFPQDAFQVKKAFVKGVEVNFADYVLEHQLDTRLPLVANYHGAQINTSFQTLDHDAKTVSFYAPVFQGIEYKHARPVEDYVRQFLTQVPQESVDTIFFSCNCILNYLYSDLEGKQLGGMTGPMTFGEIAYQLVNQTLVYLSIEEL